MTSMRAQGRYSAYRDRGRREIQAAMPLPPSAPWWWRLDPGLLAVLAIFVIFEIVAHFHYHNANGWMTLSNRIVNFEHKYGWPARLLTYGGLIVLGIHLWGGVI